MKRPIRQLFGVVVLLLMATPALAAPGGKDLARKETPAELLRKALDNNLVALEVSDQPLTGVITQLAELGKAPIVLDRSSLLLMGGDATDTMVSLRVKDVPLKAALRQLVGQHGLSFGVVGDHILVSTDDVVCQRQLKQRVSVDLEDVPLAKALKDIGRDTATNLLLDPRMVKKAADTKVTLKLDDVPMETAVRIMAELGDLKPARMGNVLFVTTADRADRLKDHDPPPTNPYWPGMPGGGLGPGIGVAPAMPAPVAPAVPAPPPPAAPPVVPKDKAG